MHKKDLKYLSSSTFVILALIAVGGLYLFKNNAQHSIKEIHPSYAANYANDRILMGASHNVFVGKINRQLETREFFPGLISTLFEVEVVSNIKGELDDKIILRQQGGYVGGILYVVRSGDMLSKDYSSNDYLLKPGNTYLFATRYSGKNDFYTLNSHPNAIKNISSNPYLSKDQLLEISLNDLKAQAFREAYKNEIIFDADVKNKNVPDRHNPPQLEEGSVAPIFLETSDSEEAQSVQEETPMITEAPQPDETPIATEEPAQVEEAPISSEEPTSTETPAE